MDIRDETILDRSAHWLNELIQLCRRMGRIYTRNPKLTAEVTRKAKALQTSLAPLREFLDKPRPPNRPEGSNP